MAEEEVIPIEEGAGPVPALKWDQGLFEQIVRGFQFPAEWDARYPQQGQTATGAPPGYITLFADFFIDGNFRLPATYFMATILHFYGFHISQLSPIGMVRIRHFEFVCRSQGLEPSADKFRVFYQLIRNMGFYSFAQREAKKILINPPKSFHDWKIKFFFIHEEVILIAMLFRKSDRIEKEEFSIPKAEDWYTRLMASPNRVYGEQVLVAAGMSDKWPPRSKEVHVLMFNGEVGIFASPPTATEGVHLPKQRPLRGVTSARKKILYLSSEESVGSSIEELSSWSKIFAGALRDLGIDPEEKKTKNVTTKKASSKKVTVEAGATSKKAGGGRATVEILEKGTLHFHQSNLEDYIVASDSLEGLFPIGEKPKSSTTASNSSGSAGSRVPESGATPSSIPEEEEEDEEEAARWVARKRSREEAAATTPPAQKAAATKPIGKQGRLRSLYKFHQVDVLNLSFHLFALVKINTFSFLQRC
ncbi:hypothetical protein HanIR_Chr02g0061031 [Helianthus annuus]|nr:hypothetical protein HanIR_Chr02g0061031 [Helianthus annuus]